MLDILPSECDCDKCSLMCHSPCCGTVEDIDRLIDAGFADRLMIDSWPDAETMIKPALKFFEGQKAPFQTASLSGCTFWKEGRCDLHHLGLKPTQGKLTMHNSTEEEHEKIAKFILESWGTKEAKKVIRKWKKSMKNQSSAKS